MRIRFLSVILIGILALLMLGCVASEKQTKQAKQPSPDETAIMAFFQEMEVTWNKQDADTYIKFYHDDLKLKLRDENKIIRYYTKQEYAKMLPKRMADFGPFKIVDVKIVKLEGDKALVKANVRKKTRDYPQKFNLVRVNGQWTIISNKW